MRTLNSSEISFVSGGLEPLSKQEQKDLIIETTIGVAAFTVPGALLGLAIGGIRGAICGALGGMTGGVLGTAAIIAIVANGLANSSPLSE